jgi:hypothetical protein
MGTSLLGPSGEELYTEYKSTMYLVSTCSYLVSAQYMLVLMYSTLSLWSAGVYYDGDTEAVLSADGRGGVAERVSSHVHRVN